MWQGIAYSFHGAGLMWSLEGLLGTVPTTTCLSAGPWRRDWDSEHARPGSGTTTYVRSLGRSFVLFARV